MATTDRSEANREYYLKNKEKIKARRKIARKLYKDDRKLIHKLRMQHDPEYRAKHIAHINEIRRLREPHRDEYTPKDKPTFISGEGG